MRSTHQLKNRDGEYLLLESNKMNRDWKDISYLKVGNSRQQKAYRVLTKLQILKHLEDYSPIVVGTIPLGIDIPSSDLDIVCEFDTRKDELEKILIDHYGDFKDFTITQMGIDAYAYNFWIDGFEIEVYASKVPTERSNSYRHLLIGSRLITLYGNNFKNKIIQLKKAGYRTERAFSKLLNLPGEVYEAIFIIEDYSDEELLALRPSSQELK